MSTLKTPFKYDFVGSFLRPQRLKDAKAKYKNNEITKDEYDKIVNEEITKLLAKQKELGFHDITDGEFRRTFWHLDFMWKFEGVAHEDTGNGVKFDAELAKLDDTYLIGKIKPKAHPLCVLAVQDGSYLVARPAFSAVKLLLRFFVRQGYRCSGSRCQSVVERSCCV